MLTMYTTAVKYGYMNMEQVPSLYQEDVKRNLGIAEEPIEEGAAG